MPEGSHGYSHFLIIPYPMDSLVFGVTMNTESRISPTEERFTVRRQPFMEFAHTILYILPSSRSLAQSNVFSPPLLLRS